MRHVTKLVFTPHAKVRIQVFRKVRYDSHRHIKNLVERLVWRQTWLELALPLRFNVVPDNSNSFDLFLF